MRPLREPGAPPPAHPCPKARRGTASIVLVLAALAAPVAVHAAGAGGIEGTFEYSFDAPWRLEPVAQASGGPLSYGPVPLVITLHDVADLTLDAASEADEEHGDQVNEDLLSLGNFCRFTVVDPNDRVNYDFSQLDEVELGRGRWQWPSVVGSEPDHALCRAWKGEDCSDLQNVAGTSEWHGFKWHFVEGVEPGETVNLLLEAELTRRPEVSCTEAAQLDVSPPATIVLRSRVQVRYAEEPLPRFVGSWLYGDLHYHSQGTDNEGESGHGYRSVIRAMGAMGLDFAVASEHASNSEQFIDTDVYPQIVDGSHVDIHVTGDTLRDMSPRRFDFSHGLIHGGAGANDEAALERRGGLPQNVSGHRVVPQLLLGGEVDAIPELAEGSEGQEILTYGDGRRFSIPGLCQGWHDDGVNSGCDTGALWETAEDGVLIRDVQGFNTLDYARDHLVYLPATGDVVVPGTEDDEPLCTPCSTSLIECGDPIPCSECKGICKPLPGSGPRSVFIASSTGVYGGASRRLVHPHQGRPALLPEIEEKGYAFLAHPLAAGHGGEGPASVPWSDSMLEQAWRSRSVLGLQLWNENTRLYSPVRKSTDPDPSKPAFVRGYERDEGDFAPKPADTARAGFLREDGLFELVPWEPVSAEWKYTSPGVPFSLKSGLFTWDRMLRWGLDEGRTESLPWLPAGEPRRIFMAGGSDAHGDLNYHRVGYYLGTTHTSDTAIGSPRNLVQVAPGAGTAVPVEDLPESEWPLRYSHQEVVDALADGSFSVTDGPALRIAVDRNGNGAIDPADAAMGDVLHVSTDQLTVPLLVQWKSTPEFGGVARIELFVGTQDGAAGRTYAPYRHGPRGPTSNRGLPSGTAYLDDVGLLHERLDDAYWRLQETSTTTLRLPLGGAGPPIEMCDVQVRFCLQVPGEEIPPDDGEIPGGPFPTQECYVKEFADPCSQCSLLASGGELLLCEENGEFLPGEEPEAPLDNFQGVERVLLDLSAFEPARRRNGERFYLRAFARTHGPGDPARECDYKLGDCLERYAFTNPIWVVADLPGDGGGNDDDPCTGGGRDRDGDGMPDSCDSCPDDPSPICLPPK